MNDKLSFRQYYSAIEPIIGRVRLVFEFLPELQGISYLAVRDDGSLQEYLRSHYLVRDRAQLGLNDIWNELKDDFNKKIVVGCDGCWFYCHETAWSPSVDVAFLLDQMGFISKMLGTPESVLDYGCGAGVVGLCLAKKYEAVKRLSLVDINPWSLYSSHINLIGNKIDASKAIWLGNCLSAKDDFDLGFVTPFYFPVEKSFKGDYLAKIKHAAADSAQMVRDVSQHCKDTIFVYSSIASMWFTQALGKDFKNIAELEVPFTLGDNVSNKYFVDEALANGLVLMKDNAQFRFWHKIYVAVLGK